MLKDMIEFSRIFPSVYAVVVALQLQEK